MLRPGCLAALLALILLPLPAAAVDGWPFTDETWRWSETTPLLPSEPGPAAWSGSSLDAASAGDQALAVWYSWGRILATRIGADGALLDPYPTVLGTSEPERTFADAAPMVAWNGRRWLVIWQSDFSEVRGQFVGTDGRLERDQFVIPGDPFGRSLAVGSNGSSFLVAAGGSALSAPALHITLIHDDGSMQPVTGFALEHATAVASDGDRYLVFAQPLPIGQGGSAHLISASGERVSTTPLTNPVSTAEWTGTSYLARARGELLELTADGVLTGSRSLPGGNSILSLPGGQIWIAWSTPIPSHDPKVYVAPLEAVDRPASLSEQEGVLTSVGGRPVLVSADDRGIRHRFLSASEPFITPEPPLPTAISSPDQRSPSAIATDAGYFAVWTDRRGAIDTLRGMAIAARGGRFREIEIAEGNNQASVAAGDHQVLVVWYHDDQGARRLLGRRFSASGDPLDPEPLVIASDPYVPVISYVPAPGVSWNGSTFVLAWSTIEGIRTARLTSEGIVLDPGGVLMPTSDRGSSSFQQRPVLASTGEVTLLVWQDGEWPWECRITCPPPPPPARTEAIRLDRNLVPLDPAPLVFAPERLQAFPDVAASEGQFLIAATGIEGVEGFSVRADGSLIGGGALLDLVPGVRPLEAEGPIVTGVRGGFVVAGSTGDQRPWDGATFRNDDRVLMTFVPAGPAVQTEGFTAVAIEGTEAALPRPVVASGPYGGLLLLFGRWSKDEGLVQRIEMKTLLPPPPPRTRPARR